MHNRHLLTILLMLVFDLSLVNSQGCSTPGWFGSNCQYKCHCENDICDSTTGQCTGSSKCTRGWFGLGCQYQDLTTEPSTTLTSYPLQTSNTWITDRDYSTCNQDTNLQSVVVAWNTTYPFSWLRLAIKDGAYPGTLVVSFKTSGDSSTETPCNNQQIYLIDTKTVDISCQMAVDVMQVIIGGQSVKSLCSIYISGGRNIALKQTATQSSNYILEGISLSQASNAVDGNTSSNIRINTCSHTGFYDSPPNWNVTFQENHTINRIVLYNRVDSQDLRCCPERLIHFGLQTFNDRYRPVFSFRDSGDTAMLIYTVIVPDDQRRVLINGIRVNSSTNVLTLCEVQAFEECAPGAWGLECNTKCNPSCGTSCHVENGLCQSCIGSSNPTACNKECTPGLWGRDCKYSCSSHCSNTSCGRHSGICDQGCNGYDNFPDCNQKCFPGKWGVNCTNECNNCVNKSCDHISGKCTVACEVGYINFTDCSAAPSQVQDNPLRSTVIGLGVGLGVACAFNILLLVLIFARKRRRPSVEVKCAPSNYDTATSGKEYIRHYEAPGTTAQYQNASYSYKKGGEEPSFEKPDAQPYKVTEEDTNTMNVYESIGLNKFD